MSKELAGIELTFAKVIEEAVLLEALSSFLGINRAALWNLEWGGEVPTHVYAFVSYTLMDEVEYPLLSSLLFNQYLAAEPAFELKFAYALAQQFDCAVLIGNETGGSDDFLEVSPAGLVRWCSYEEDENGQKNYHYWPYGPFTYQETVNRIEERAREAV